jgi:hypothetical protein
MHYYSTARNNRTPSDQTNYRAIEQRPRGGWELMQADVNLHTIVVEYTRAVQDSTFVSSPLLWSVVSMLTMPVLSEQISPIP